MLNKKMTDALNGQINKELYSSYLYLSLSSYASQLGLKGTANWFMIQAQEEMTHAMRFYAYVTNHGAHAVLKAIAEPPAKFKNVVEMFEKTLEHEQFVTKSINDLATLARKESDHATEIMLQWFVTEQIEEEGNVHDILAQLKLAGEGSGLFMIDRELATRVFVPPAAPAAT
jgi:ferritin